ncbi:hypothetical protein [Nguyenibacter vanlangensis]|uniref:Uncharacterized protein n=1 Tax=Nguyenibacter vanlangensis TaxID=1216886 RepID=A0A7Y7IVB1_9PROT|nr:hypothetical protein [Nguyenibacter vanlangensis]NVN10967.1 hypothetical protein [Nguyenibacter vanlangensis]
MYFSRMARSGAIVAVLAFGTATGPAQAQEVLHVVDARGHQVGVLVPVPDVPAVAAFDTAMFDALDHMMARDIAVMEATDRELAGWLNSALRPVPAVVPAVDHAMPSQGLSWRRFEVVSIGGPAGASCTQTITMTSNGQSAPVVHASSTGGRACATLATPMAVENPGRQGMDAPAPIPAVDTPMAAPANKREGKAL